jgi:hypothetical protein
MIFTNQKTCSSRPPELYFRIPGGRDPLLILCRVYTVQVGQRRKKKDRHRQKKKRHKVLAGTSMHSQAYVKTFLNKVAKLRLEDAQ